MRPDVVVLVELEVWPNFVRVARARNVTVTIVNGRMREKWVGVYRKLGFLLRPLLDPAGPNLFCAQNETYRDRLCAPDFRPKGPRDWDDEVRHRSHGGGRREIGAGPRGAGIDGGRTRWIASCTWPGEEEICLGVHRLLHQRFRRSG